MNPLAFLTGLSLTAWLRIAAIAGVLAGGWYLHHHVWAQGYDQAQAKYTAKVSALTTQVAALESSGSACSSALQDVSAKADMAKAQSDAQLKHAAQLLQQIGQEAVQAETDKASALAALEQARKSPNCATVASMSLCSAMSKY